MIPPISFVPLPNRISPETGYVVAKFGPFGGPFEQPKAQRSKIKRTLFILPPLVAVAIKDFPASTRNEASGGHGVDRLADELHMTIGEDSHCTACMEAKDFVVGSTVVD